MFDNSYRLNDNKEAQSKEKRIRYKHKRNKNYTNSVKNLSMLLFVKIL